MSAVTTDWTAASQPLNYEERMRLAEAGPRLKRFVTNIGYSACGMLVLLLAWWLGGRWISNHPDLSGFSDFAPAPTFAALQRMWASGEVWTPIMPSLARIGESMFYAGFIGVPTGIAIGRFRTLRQTLNMPMQFLRMISPLSWMPIAVMVFDTWESSIVFLITMAAMWPIVFATANGLSKIDRDWYTVARNLGANPMQQLWYVILPATAQDILTGFRLALGVAWVVLVPAEFLGVTSGLGYAVNDARDCLEYDRLAATVVVIGVIGYLLDSTLRIAITRVNWREEST